MQYKPDSEWATRVLAKYGYISNTSETPSNPKIISTLSPMVEALRKSIKDSMEIYMRIPLWGEWRDEDFDQLMRSLTKNLSIYWTWKKLWGSELSRPLLPIDILLRLGTINWRLMRIIWVMGESHQWYSKLIDGSDFSLAWRIGRYQVMGDFLRFFQESVAIRPTSWKS